RMVEKQIAKSPDERYQSAKDMLIDLRSLKKRMDVEVEIKRTASYTTSIAANRTEEVDPRKKRVLLVALIGMAIVTAAIFGISKWRASRARSIAPGTTPTTTQPVRTRNTT